MTPEISLVYNSNGGDGVMGPGWAIGGISVISNVRKNEYYSGEANQFDESSYFNTKQFTLDGQRLIEKGVATSFPEAEYRTEDETFVKVNRIAYGQDGFCFYTNTKSGLKHYYGWNDNSRQRSSLATYLPQRAVMNYFISKSEDRLGNEIIYNYTNIASAGECYISSIVYGDGDCKIRFLYENRATEIISRVTHKGDPLVFEVKKKLYKIESLYKDVVYRTYNLTYLPQGTTANEYLETIELVGENGDKFNKTVFSHPELPTDVYSFELNENLQNDGKPYIGDFNGDGLNDVCFQLTSVPYGGQDIDTKVVDMYRNNGDGTFTKMPSLSNHENHFNQQVIIADFNGDGISDVLLTVMVDGTNKLSGDLYLFDKNFSCANSTYPQIIESYGGIDYYRADVGDFDGDGQADILIKYPTHSLCYYGTESTTEPLITKSQGITWPSGLSNSPYIYYIFADFNGNGRTDLLELNVRGDDHLFINDVDDFEDKTCYIDIVEDDDFLVGDFNGDLISDIAVIKEDSKFSIYQSHGESFVKTLADKTIPIENESYDKSSFFTGDFNADGRTDIFRSLSGFYEFPSFDSFFEEIILVSSINGDDLIIVDKEMQHTIASSKNSKTPKLLQHFGASIVGDFNADGISDLFCNIMRTSGPFYTGSFYTEGHLLTSNHPLDKVTAITNGLGTTSTIAYKPLAGADRQTGVTPDFPIAYLPGPLNTVSKIAISDEIYTSETNYFFYGPRVHMQGKGFIGFLSAKTSTKLSDTRWSVNAIANEIDEDYYFLKPILAQTFLASQANGGTLTLLSETISRYDKKQYYEGTELSRRYLPVLTKTLTKSYEGDGSFIKTIRFDFGYNAYGDLLYQHSYMDDDPSLTIDSYGGSFEFREISTNTYFEADEENWILGRLKETWVMQETTGLNPVTRHSTFEYYDSGGTKGMLKMESQQPGESKTFSKVYSYYPNGNLKRSRTYGSDFEERIDEIKYDEDNRFIQSTINSLDFADYKEYHPFTGKATLFRDPNELEITTEYDGLGRESKTVHPNGVVTVSAVRWVTDDDNDAPESEKKPCYYTWTKSSGGAATKHYFDKYSRELRVVTTGFDNQIIYVDKEYNKYGLLTKVSEPYFKSSGAAGVLFVEYKYDDLNRTIKVTAPGDRVTTTQYQGLKTSITNPASQTSSKIVNAAGWLVESIDANNESNTYEYYSNGLLHKILDPVGNATILEYDKFGNRTKLADPDLGITTFIHNPIGELLSKTDANNVTTTYQYDKLGRLEFTFEPEGVIHRTYDTAPNGKGKLASVEGPNTVEKYYYDHLSRLERTEETFGGEVFTTTNTFDILGRTKTLIYPSGFEVRNIYDGNSYLKRVTQADNGKVLWEARNINARGQFTEFALGNGLSTSQEFDPNTGLVTAIYTPNTQDLEFAWYDIANLKYRVDHSKSIFLKEEFLYDNLNRLDEIIKNGVRTLDMEYDKIGNITYKSDVGTYGYESSRPHAVTSVNGSNLPISLLLQSIQYTSFSKIKHIDEGENSLDIIYGSSHERKILKEYKNGNVTRKKYYAGGGIYEKETENGSIKEIHYLSGGTGLFAIYTISKKIGEEELKGKNETTSDFKYVHVDHLGSIQSITDENGALIEEYSYDAWGKRRDPLTWEAFAEPPKLVMDRGFTGHEHLDLFELVNMNGRIYDPVLGRFLSADPYSQMPEHTQGLNRYSYVLNNPLSLTDPSGFMIDESAAFFGMMVAMVVTAVVTSVFTFGATTPLWVAVLATAASGAVGGFCGGVTTALLSGGTLSQALTAGLIGAAIGAASAAASFGIGELFKNTHGFVRAVGSAAAHGTFQGGLRLVQGGRFELGFISAFTSSLALSYTTGKSNDPLAIMGIGAAIGGTAEALGGGKFANGAVTGAFVALFNHGMHPPQSKGGDPRDIKLTKVKDLQELVNAMSDLSEQYRIEIGGAVVVLDGNIEYYILPAEYNGAVNKIDEAQYHGSMLPEGSKLIEHYHTHLTNNAPSYQDAFNAYRKTGATSYVLANTSVYRVDNSRQIPMRGAKYGTEIGSLADWKKGIFTGK